MARNRIEMKMDIARTVRSLDRNSGAARREMRTELKTARLRATAALKARLPVGPTGQLKRSAGSVYYDDAPAIIIYMGGPPAHYAHYVEYGTRRQRAQRNFEAALAGPLKTLAQRLKEIKMLDR